PGRYFKAQDSGHYADAERHCRSAQFHDARRVKERSRRQHQHAERVALFHYPLSPGARRGRRALYVGGVIPGRENSIARLTLATTNGQSTNDTAITTELEKAARPVCTKKQKTN